jgi:type III pantothenate kinase
MRALLVDIGNTRIKWRVETIGAKPTAAAPLQAVALDGFDADWSAALAPFDAAFVSSVASPDDDAAFENAIAAAQPGAVITRVVATAAFEGLVNGYANPAQLGSDRWLAAIGARTHLPARALLVCGFGTATTLDLVLPSAGTGGDARFVGGLILPGVDTMRTALARDTARLPDTRGVAFAFADNTADAIESGGIAAQRGALEQAWRAARERAGAASLECVVSDGAAPRVFEGWDQPPTPLTRLDDLVLRGLAAVAGAARL